MSAVLPYSRILYSEYSASLSNGEEFDSGWIDFGGIDKIQFSGYASSAGSAQVVLFHRKRGEAWKGRVYDPTTASVLNEKFEGALVYDELTDIKFTVEDVSDNNTIATAFFEGYLIDL